MSEMIDVCVTGLNSIGRGVCTYAAGMFLQTAVLVTALLLLDVVLRKHVRATLRYWIWLLVFIKLLLPPGLSVPTGVGYWWGRYAPASPVSPVESVESAAPVTVREKPPVSLGTSDSRPVAAYAAPAVAEPVESTTGGAARLSWQGGVFLLWGAGVLVFGLLLIQRLFFVRRLIARGRPAQSDLVDILDGCRLRMGVRREVGLLLSPDAFSPAVCGLLRPVILMPAKLLEQLPADGVEAVLIHELAHLKRGDLWINCAQTVLQIIYFYNPLVWLAGAMVRRVREQAVDEMVLVALGAEARSYGRTLIDIAEMAFLRGGPALGLLGVAESKKSLEGRIKHMLTRPIPTSARVGAVGVFIIVVFGAVLLPMARGQSGAAQDDSLVARLSGGATVELLGVCNWPQEGRGCWRPDGTKLAKEIYATKSNTAPGSENYGFMVRMTGPQDANIKWRTIEGATGWEGSCLVEDSQGRVLDNCTAAISDMQAGKTSTTIRIGVATGAWSTISSHDGKGMYSGSRTGVVWSRAFEDSMGTHVIASAEWRRDRAERIVAVDSKGTVHTGSCGSVASGNVDQYTASFPGLGLDQIRQFQFQVRPYQWAQFSNVSLRPGHETKVTVGAEEPDDQVSADRVLSTSDARDEASRQRLMNLGKALLIYANDMHDKLPDTLLDVRDYIREKNDFSWMLENVTYLGKDVDVRRDKPDRVLAYDKTLLKEGRGTNVLYLDSHVAFESPDELERLGIPVAGPETPEGKLIISRLRRLALTANIYAHEHEGVFAEDMEALKPYVGDEAAFAWMLTNVEYLGKSLKSVDRRLGAATRPLAYRASSGRLTAVVFSDGHAEWLTADRLEELGIAPAGSAQPVSTETGSDSLPNLFIMGSPRGTSDIFGAVIARAREWTWNNTGRNHTKKAYDEIFNGTHNRTDHDVLVLIFALDQQERIPSEYEDLLPQPWPQIEEQLKQGRVVELSGRARGLHVILLAAPKAEQLQEVIAGSRLLGDPQALLGRSGKGCDVAVENFVVGSEPDRGTFWAVVSIRNAGTAPSPQFVVSFYLGDPATAKPMIHGAGPIKPGETWNERSLDFGLTDGVKEIHVVLDPADLVEELDETNNRAMLRVVVKDGKIAEQSLIRNQ